MKLARLSLRVKEVFRSQGWSEVVRRALLKVRRVLLVTNDAYWFVRDLRKDIERPCPSSPVEIEFSKKEETIRWLQEKSRRFGWLYIPEEVSLSRALGHYLPSVRLNGEIIGYIKIARERAYVLDYEREFRLPPEDAFVIDTFVLPEHRGKKIASFLVAEALAFLRGEGYQRVWCHIPGWNIASITAFRRSGFRKLAHIRFFRVLGLPFFTINPERLVRRIASASPPGCRRRHVGECRETPL